MPCATRCAPVSILRGPISAAGNASPARRRAASPTTPSQAALTAARQTGLRFSSCPIGVRGGARGDRSMGPAGRGHRPHARVRRRPRPGGRRAQGGVHLGPAHHRRTRRANGPGARGADLRRPDRGHRRPGRTPGPSVPVHPPARKRVSRKAVAFGAGAIVLPPALIAAFLTFYGGFIILFLVAFIGVVVSAAPISPHGGPWRPADIRHAADPRAPESHRPIALALSTSGQYRSRPSRPDRLRSPPREPKPAPSRLGTTSATRRRRPGGPLSPRSRARVNPPSPRRPSTQAIVVQAGGQTRIFHTEFTAGRRAAW